MIVFHMEDGFLSCTLKMLSGLAPSFILQLFTLHRLFELHFYNPCILRAICLRINNNCQVSAFKFACSVHVKRHGKFGIEKSIL